LQTLIFVLLKTVFAEATLLFVLLKTVFAEATLLFGRGMRAGIDRREQKKTAAEFEANMLRKSREAFGLATDTLQVGG